MIKTTKIKDAPKRTLDDRKDFLVDLNRDPHIGYSPRIAGKMRQSKEKRRKGGK